jgi:DNA/RNA-binding domain of Phe-tRNA-synthetase-like protein
MLEIINQLATGWRDCALGALILRGVQNNLAGDPLGPINETLRPALVTRYGSVDRQGLKLIHPLDVYVSYYKKYGYTYHVLPQLESLLRGQTRTSVSPLVDAMFMAEMKNGLLTAGHDLGKVEFPLGFKNSTGEKFTALNGKQVSTVPGDFQIEDRQGVISSILRGPDLRTRLEAQTRRVLFTVYAPCRIAAKLIYQHMEDLETQVKITSPEGITELKEVWGG